MSDKFCFGNFAFLTDGEIDLCLEKKVPADPAKGYLPSYQFAITQHDTAQRVGGLVLRVGASDQSFYTGNLGFGVDEPFRGRHYAEKACRLVRQVALHHNVNSLILACRPDNVASKRTIERLGASLRGQVDIPPTHELYAERVRQGLGTTLLRYEWLL